MSITIDIEYLSMSALLNSIGMQAIVEKHLEQHPGLMPEGSSAFNQRRF